MAEQLPDDAPRIVAVPSDRLWFDPRALNVATFAQWSDVVVSMGVPRVVVPANPRRWGLGFGIGPLSPGITFAPWPDVGTFALITSTGFFTVPFMTLQTYGPIVSLEWSAAANSTQTIRVVELIRN